MKATKKIILGISKVFLALLACVLMPVLIWVALGVAIFQKISRKEAGKEPVPTLGKILAAAAIKK